MTEFYVINQKCKLFIFIYHTVDLTPIVPIILIKTFIVSLYLSL